MVEVGSVTHVLVGVDLGEGADVSEIWPADSVLTAAELAAWFSAEKERLSALEDSAARLRAVLSPPQTSPPTGDSRVGPMPGPGPVAVPPSTPDTLWSGRGEETISLADGLPVESDARGGPPSP
jgi:hypothetical protein